MEKLNIFLGGTCVGKDYRNELIPELAKYNISYFDPVVDDWNKIAQQRELWARETCDFCLYVITPAMQGVYSIAEVVDDSNKRPEKTVFCVLESYGDLTFSEQMLKSMKATANMVKRNGAFVCYNLSDLIKHFVFKLKNS